MESSGKMNRDIKYFTYWHKRDVPQTIDYQACRFLKKNPQVCIQHCTESVGHFQEQLDLCLELAFLGPERLDEDKNELKQKYVVENLELGRFQMSNVLRVLYLKTKVTAVLFYIGIIQNLFNMIFLDLKLPLQVLPSELRR